MKTLESYLEQNPTKGIFPFVEYMKDYQQDYQQIDKIFLNRYQDWECRRFDPPTLLLYIQNLFAVNSYKYETLAATLNLEYNPIENYSMTESGTDEHTGKDNRSLNVGAQAISGTQNLGAEQTTTTNSVSPMDSSTYLKRDQQVADRDSVTNSSNQNVGERTDIETTDRDLTITHNFKRSGNIGVTTSQQMLESERQVALFNLYNVIWEDIIKEFFSLGVISQLGGKPYEYDLWYLFRR